DAGTSYHLPVALRLRGPLDRDSLELALRDIVERHEVLRTVVTAAPDGTRQRILPQQRIPSPLLRVMPAGEPAAPDGVPFDLER
ncbi:hypothetical protein G3M53_50870, partial [Streptomyces sp. SID7982]|nr:hypothetical protein [Streptomyces sp. SID7982]